MQSVVDRMDYPGAEMRKTLEQRSMKQLDRMTHRKRKAMLLNPYTAPEARLLPHGAGLGARNRPPPPRPQPPHGPLGPPGPPRPPAPKPKPELPKPEVPKPEVPTPSNNKRVRDEPRPLQDNVQKKIEEAKRQRQNPPTPAETGKKRGRGDTPEVVKEVTWEERDQKLRKLAENLVTPSSDGTETDTPPTGKRKRDRPSEGPDQKAPKPNPAPLPIAGNKRGPELLEGPNQKVPRPTPFGLQVLPNPIQPPVRPPSRGGPVLELVPRDPSNVQMPSETTQEMEMEPKHRKRGRGDDRDEHRTPGVMTRLNNFIRDQLNAAARGAVENMLPQVPRASLADPELRPTDLIAQQQAAYDTYEPFMQPMTTDPILYDDDSEEEEVEMAEPLPQLTGAKRDREDDDQYPPRAYQRTEQP